MSNEFLPIPQVPLHEIDKEGNILKTDAKTQRKTPILPYPLGSNEVKLMVDGVRKSFSIDKLVSEIFGKKIKSESVQEVVVEETETSSPEISAKKIEKSEKKPKIEKEKKEKKEKVKISSDTPEVQKIMKLDCSQTIKIWKLHEIGVSIADITILVERPYNNEYVPVVTIKKYKKSQMLRDRGDKVKF